MQVLRAFVIIAKFLQAGFEILRLIQQSFTVIYIHALVGTSCTILQTKLIYVLLFSVFLMFILLLEVIATRRTMVVCQPFVDRDKIDVRI